MKGLESFLSRQLVHEDLDCTIERNLDKYALPRTEYVT